MNDGPLSVSVSVTPVADPAAFSHLGVDPAGRMTYLGNNTFNYFGPDWNNPSTPAEQLSEPRQFNDPELRERLGLPDPDENDSEEPPKATWTTTPKELIRDSSKPIVLSTTPDVCKTPMGSSAPAIPYCTWADPANDQGYASSVFATQNKVMVLRSDITVTHGAEPGTAKGVKSGTINDITEPLEHSSNVRAEGSYVIRHLDRAYMNKRNNFGEFVYVEDVTTRSPAPDEEDEEDPGFFGRLWEGAKDLNEDYQLMQRGVGALQAVGGAGEMVLGGAIVVGSGVGTVFSGGTATPVMVVTATGGGLLAAKGGDDTWAGLKTLWTGEVHDSYLDQGVAAVGAAMGASEEAIAVMQGVAGAAGPPTGVLKEGAERAVREGLEEGAERAAREGAEAAAGEGAEKAAREGAGEASEETAEKNARVSAKRHKVRCFEKPSGVTDKEFLDQLHEQEAVLNSMTADGLVARRDAIKAAGGTKALREPKYQAAARDAYIEKMTGFYTSQGHSERSANALAKADAKSLHATHRLDIIAGGDPKDISGMQNAKANSSIGAQWRGSRSQAIEDYAREMQKTGDGRKKMRVKLEKC